MEGRRRVRLTMSQVAITVNPPSASNVETEVMSAYWMTFRLENDPQYAQRYDSLVETVRDMAQRWWIESTSFLLFETALSIDEVAAKVKSALDTAKDLALIGMPDYKSARVVGASQDGDLFTLMPFTKRA